MQLDKVDISKLKALKGKSRIKKIQGYRKQKENLVQEYLRLQDTVEHYQDQSNLVCCKIERINIILKKMEE